MAIHYLHKDFYSNWPLEMEDVLGFVRKVNSRFKKKSLHSHCKIVKLINHKFAYRFLNKKQYISSLGTFWEMS
jgi:hypothetical protein